ncbi:MAG: hypothetical protein U5K38_01695 [Woeseiaceae bacterium]|nr:hypothetical protein [Woeseiaceae bacterium]
MTGFPVAAPQALREALGIMADLDESASRPDIEPRCLSRAQAARYLGIGRTLLESHRSTAYPPGTTAGLRPG